MKLHSAWLLCWGLPILLVGCKYPTRTVPTFHDASKSSSLVSTSATPAMSQIDLTNRFDENWLRPSTELFTLGPGDKIEIEILGDAASKSATVVAPDGNIYYNLLPALDVWGLTLSQAKAQLERELAKYVREPPQVSLVLREVQSRHLWVLGQV